MNEVAGDADGAGNEAQFSIPIGIVQTDDSTFLVVDRGNNKLRMLTEDAQGNLTVQMFAGCGFAGYLDGAAANAQFNGPSDICLMGNARLAIVERYGHRIRAVETPQTVGPAKERYDELRASMSQSIQQVDELLSHVPNSRNVLLSHLSQIVNLVHQVTCSTFHTNMLDTFRARGGFSSDDDESCGAESIAFILNVAPTLESCVAVRAQLAQTKFSSKTWLLPVPDTVAQKHAALINLPSVNVRLPGCQEVQGLSGELLWDACFLRKLHHYDWSAATMHDASTARKDIRAVTSLGMFAHPAVLVTLLDTMPALCEAKMLARSLQEDCWAAPVVHMAFQHFAEHSKGKSTLNDTVGGDASHASEISFAVARWIARSVGKFSLESLLCFCAVLGKQAEGGHAEAAEQERLVDLGFKCGWPTDLNDSQTLQFGSAELQQSLLWACSCYMDVASSEDLSGVVLSSLQSSQTRSSFQSALWGVVEEAVLTAAASMDSIDLIRLLRDNPSLMKDCLWYNLILAHLEPSDLEDAQRMTSRGQVWALAAQLSTDTDSGAGGLILANASQKFKDIIESLTDGSSSSLVTRWVSDLGPEMGITCTVLGITDLSCITIAAQSEAAAHNTLRSLIGIAHEFFSPNSLHRGYSSSDGAKATKALILQLEFDWDNLLLSQTNTLLLQSASPEMLLPWELVRARLWFESLVGSLLFQKLWFRTLASGVGVIEALGTANREWKLLYSRLSSLSIGFPEIQALGPALLQENELSVLDKTANSEFLVQIDTNSEWLETQIRCTGAWKHLHQLYHHASRALQCIEMLESEIGQTAQTHTQAQMEQLIEMVERKEWDNHMLSDTDAYSSVLGSLDSRLTEVDLQILKVLITEDATDFVDWLSTIPDDSEFSNAIESAMGKPVTQCPEELWIEPPGNILLNCS